MRIGGPILCLGKTWIRACWYVRLGSSYLVSQKSWISKGCCCEEVLLSFAKAHARHKNVGRSHVPSLALLRVVLAPAQHASRSQASLARRIIFIQALLRLCFQCRHLNQSLDEMLSAGPRALNLQGDLGDSCLICYPTKPRFSKAPCHLKYNLVALQHFFNSIPRNHNFQSSIVIQFQFRRTSLIRTIFDGFWKTIDSSKDKSI